MKRYVISSRALKKVNTMNKITYKDLFDNLNCYVNPTNRARYEHRTAFQYNDNVYTCCICGKKTSLYKSFSNLGNNLICMKCAMRYFKSDQEAIYFCKGDLKNLERLKKGGI